MSNSGRWFLYAKGGRYQKWAGLEWSVVNWMQGGASIKEFVMTIPGTNHWTRYVPSESYYFQSGLTYSLIAHGCFAVRVLDDAIFDAAGVSIFPVNIVYRPYLAALMETHLTSYMLRVTTQVEPH